MELIIKNEKELKEKFKGVDIENKIENIIEHYQKKPFKEQFKRVWIEQIKEFLFLENLEFDNTSFSEADEDVKWEFVELISGKNKEWGKASELLRNYVMSKLHLYTTKDDNKSEVWVYKEGIYIPNGRSEIKELLRKTLGDFYTQFAFNKVIEKIEPDTYIDIDKFFNQNYPEEIPVENGILNIFTRELSEFNPDKIFFNKLQARYDSEKECSQIDKFLKEILAREEDIKVFYELGGFCLLKEYKFEKAFMFVGDGRNGKDKSLELLKRLIGIANCCSVPLSSLAPDSFIISEFFGRMVNIAGDINNKDLKDTSTFKALTGRSLVSAQRKFLNAITFVNYAKFIFACNELPMVYDTSRGFWDRWILLEFPYTFVPENELEEGNDFLKLRDEGIIDKITTEDEMSGFLNKCLEGLDRLLEGKTFSNTLGSQEIKDMWIRKSNSVMSFCMENVIEDYDSTISKKAFRKKYVDYCKKHKLKTKSDYVIKRTLEEEYGVSEENTQLLGDRWIKSWGGIKWKN